MAANGRREAVPCRRSFMEAIKAASKDASSRFVVVIEEINRGNPAQILGELLTLWKPVSARRARLWNSAIPTRMAFGALFMFRKTSSS